MGNVYVTYILWIFLIIIHVSEDNTGSLSTERDKVTCQNVNKVQQKVILINT